MSPDRPKNSDHRIMDLDTLKRLRILEDFQRLPTISDGRHETSHADRCPPRNPHTEGQDRTQCPGDRSPVYNHTNPDSQSGHPAGADESGQTERASS